MRPLGLKSRRIKEVDAVPGDPTSHWVLWMWLRRGDAGYLTSTQSPEPGAGFTHFSTLGEESPALGTGLSTGVEQCLGATGRVVIRGRSHRTWIKRQCPVTLFRAIDQPRRPSGFPNTFPHCHGLTDCMVRRTPHSGAAPDSCEMVSPIEMRGSQLSSWSDASLNAGRVPGPLRACSAAETGSGIRIDIGPS
jgi:hypothetical protein